MVINNYKQLIVGIALLLIIASCAAKQTALKQQLLGVPDGGRLYERIQSLYQAEKKNDWEAWFSITAPSLQDSEGRKEFQEMISKPRDFSLVSWHIIEIKCLDGSQLPPEVDGQVSVSMDVLVDTQGVREREKDQTDYWIHMNGEWYWYWRGWPAD